MHLNSVFVFFLKFGAFNSQYFIRFSQTKYVQVCDQETIRFLIMKKPENNIFGYKPDSPKKL